MYTVYVLYSRKYNKIYIGQTEDIQRRLEEHNSGIRSKYAKRYRPWELIYKEEYTTRAEALRREHQLKSQKGREYLWGIVREELKIRK